MLYVVSTTFFEDDSQVLGVYTDFDLARKAIMKFIKKNLSRPIISEVRTCNYYRAVSDEGDFSFFIDEVYPNVSLIG